MKCTRPFQRKLDMNNFNDNYFEQIMFFNKKIKDSNV